MHMSVSNQEPKSDNGHWQYTGQKNQLRGTIQAKAPM